MIAPSASSSLWDYLYVAGQRAPGLCRVSGPGITIGWDVQNPQGMAGGITTRKGEPVKEFDAEFDLSDEKDAAGVSDFDRWDPFQALLLASIPPAIPLGGGLPTNMGKPYPLDVSHPDLARCRITAATIGKIGMLQPDGKGGGKITVHFLEYRPPKPLGSVKLTKTAGDKVLEADMSEIAALKAQRDKL